MNAKNAATLADVMQAYGGAQCKAVLKDPKLYKATFDLIKAFGDKNVAAGASAIASGANSAVKQSIASKNAKDGFATGSMALSTLKATLSMAKALDATNPTKAVVIVGSATMQKAGIALGLVGSDSEQAKCIGAVIELAGSAGVTFASTATVPAISWLTWSSLAASSINAGLVCTPVIQKAFAD